MPTDEMKQLSDDDHKTLVAAKNVLGKKHGWIGGVDTEELYVNLRTLIDHVETEGAQALMIEALTQMVDRVRADQITKYTFATVLRRLADEWEPF